MNSVIALFHVNLSVMLTGARSPKSTIKRFCSLVGKFGLGGGGGGHKKYFIIFLWNKKIIKKGYVGVFCEGWGGLWEQINYLLVLVRSSNITDGMLMGDVVTSCFLCKT